MICTFELVGADRTAQYNPVTARIPEVLAATSSVSAAKLMPYGRLSPAFSAVTLTLALFTYFLTKWCAGSWPQPRFYLIALPSHL